MDKKVEAQPILSMNSVEVLYDNVMLAIKGVSIQVPKGEMIALLGSNGAGKSTTLKAISGLLKAERGRVSRGEIKFEGTDITEMLAQKRVEMGICHVIEGRRVFEHLTPDENLTAAAPMGMSRSELDGEKEKIYNYFPRLAERSNSLSGYLSGGEQQMLAIGRALVTQPSLLMLDEPSAALAPKVVLEIFSNIYKISQTGVTILIFEQNVRMALLLAEYGYIIRDGVIMLEGKSDNLIHDSSVRESFLGGTVADTSRELSA